MTIVEAESALMRGARDRRREALVFLASLTSPRALELLIDNILITDAPSDWKSIAAHAMRLHGITARKKLTGMLDSPEKNEREGALTGLAAMGEKARRSLDEIMRHVQREDIAPRERALALNVVGEIGTDAERCLATVEAFIDSPDAILRQAAVSACGKIGVNIPTVYDDLTRYLSEDDYSRRTGAVMGLLAYGRQPFDLAVWLLDHRNPGVRLSAVELLEKLTEDAPTSLPKLEALLNDTDQLVRAHAARAIAAYGHHAGRSVPVLIHALNTWQFGFWEVEYALREIGGPAIPYLRNILIAGDDERRLSVVRILDGMDDTSGISIELLCLALMDSDEHVADRALSAMRKLHPAKVRARIPMEIPMLGKFLPYLTQTRRKRADRALTVLRTNDPDEWDYYLSEQRAATMA